MSAVAAFAWLIPVAIGVVLASWLVRDRESNAWGWWRALAAGPLATLVVFGVWGLARAFDYLAGGKGPLGWVGVSRPVATATGPLVDGALRLGLGAGLVFAVALVLFAKLRSPAPRRMPLAIVGFAVALLCGLALGGVFASDPLAFAAAMPVDLVAFIPVGTIGIALAFAPVRPPTTAAPAPAAEPAPAPAPRVGRTTNPTLPAITTSTVDGEALLRKDKLVDSPTFAVEPQGAVEASSSPLDRVWATLGGAGRAPASIASVLERLGTTEGSGAMLVDLPPPTEEALVGTLLAAALLERAGRVLVICDDPARVRDRLAALFEGLDVKPPGPLVAGDGQLRDALAHNIVPVLVCVDGNDLAGTLLAAKTQRGASWLRFIQLVVIVGADRRQPIASTHLAFTLRRLSLALQHHRARAGWCAIGGSSSGSQRFVEESAMKPFERVPHGASTRAAARVFVRPARGDEVAQSELEQRQRALAATGLALTRSTASGADSYRGDCSLLVLEDRHLVPLFMARTNLAHRVGAAKGHLGLWWVDDTPLSRFLLRDGALVALEQRGELHPPRPVVGLDNIYLASSHLEASLHDGAADELGLRRAFGDRAVDQLLGASSAPSIAGARARWNPATRTIERAAIVAPSGSRTTDPRRETVSANTIEVRGSRQGEVLTRVDRRVAPTRYYPNRVFRAPGGALYQVGGDPVSDHFVVKPASTGALPSLPQLALELVDVKWAEAPKQVQIGKVSFARGVADVNLREAVTGVISRDKGTVAVKYAPVTVEYPTRAAIVMFADKPSTSALGYAGAMVQRLVPAQLQVEPDDVGVIALPAGVGQLNRPALVFVDRHLGGLGVADALDAATIHDLFRWTWGILYRCKCMNGCDQCTPLDILQASQGDKANPLDKVGALKLLGG